MTEGELPPSPPVHTYGVLRIGFSRGFVYFNRNVIKIVVTKPFCAFAAELITGENEFFDDFLVSCHSKTKFKFSTCYTVYDAAAITKMLCFLILSHEIFITISALIFMNKMYMHLQVFLSRKEFSTFATFIIVCSMMPK